MLLYNFAADTRGTTNLHQFGGLLFDESSFFADDNTDEAGDDSTVEMEISHNPTAVEVILSNGQALPPQSGQRKNAANVDAARGLHDNSGSHAQQQHIALSPVPIAAPVSELETAFTEPSASIPTASWPMPGNSSTLDMTYDPFFQFQVPGSPFFGTWEVGNL